MPDRLLGPLTARAGAALTRLLPPAVLSLAGLAAAAGALWAFLAAAPVAAGVLVLLAGLLDAAGAAGPVRDARRRGAPLPVGAGMAGAEGRGALGAVLDGVADRYADAFILGGMAAWSHGHEAFPAPLAAGFAALIGALALNYAVARVQASAGRAAAVLFAWAGRDVRMVVAAAGALTGQVYIALVALALLTHLPVVWALMRLRMRRGA